MELDDLVKITAQLTKTLPVYYREINDEEFRTYYYPIDGAEITFLRINPATGVEECRQNDEGAFVALVLK